MFIMTFLAASSFIYISGFGLNEREFSCFLAINAVFAMIGPILYVRLFLQRPLPGISPATVHLWFALHLIFEISHLFHILFTARSRTQLYASPMINEEGDWDLSIEGAKWQCDA
jgi:hypothetical protein